MEFLIRLATPQDMPWINAQYRTVQFQESELHHEIILLATNGGQPAGMGRLVKVSDEVLELGGMFVCEPYRGSGLARKLVKALLEKAGPKTIYCLPFAHLRAFYESCGFEPVADHASVPGKVLEKWTWCNQTYPDKTLLLTQQT
ncbi:GNAT family N-acetyltransferase [Pontibacter oryzae]|uniref:N-acetyltransferase n=1 Tax=Pontibacter oryzae TaxID=2304593 RepID=A0A399RWP2_9BACT|nr:GNAT family N-acetyltransferase [Pontibacter oryzae]RIJ34232.1 N-acetyltransferase [Pontibacter oryzae]